MSEEKISNLSEKEQKLFDLIKNPDKKVSIAVIGTELGKEYIGCLGRLLGRNLIEGKKEWIGDDNSPYGRKKVKYYVEKKS